MDCSIDLIHLLKNAAACCERILQASLSESEVSMCQAMVLEEIDAHAESMSKLSKKLCCHKSNITQIVDTLVRSGMVERSPCKEDRRVFHLGITVKGMSELKKSKKAMRAAALHCFSGYSQQEREALRLLLMTFVEMHVHPSSERQAADR